MTQDLTYINFLIALLVVAGFGGVTMNSIFLWLNLSKPEFRKDYFLFLTAVSFLNFVHSWIILVFQPIAVGFNIDEHGIFCSLMSYIHIVTGVGGISVQTLLCFNRFVSLYYPQKMKTIFTSRNIFLMLFTVWSIPAICGAGLWILNDFGRPKGSICCPSIDTMLFSHMLLVYGPMMTSYSLSLFFTYKISRMIKTHQQQVGANLGSRLQTAKDIVRLIIIDIAVPLTMETPAVVVCFLAATVNIPIPIFDVALFFFVLHSTTDPLIALLVVKPYRKAVKNVISFAKTQTSRVVPTTSATPRV